MSTPLGVLDSALAAVAEIFRFLNTKESKKYLNRSVELQLEIQKEDAKGDDSDDAKIEALQKELKVIFQAAREEFVTHIASHRKS